MQVQASSSLDPVIFKTPEDILDWQPSNINPLMIASVPIAPRIAYPQLRFIAGLDNGQWSYWSEFDRNPQGGPSGDVYNFPYWQYVDKIYYYMHSLAAVPPAVWTNAASQRRADVRGGHCGLRYRQSLFWRPAVRQAVRRSRQGGESVVQDRQHLSLRRLDVRRRKLRGRRYLYNGCAWRDVKRFFDRIGIVRMQAPDSGYYQSIGIDAPDWTMYGGIWEKKTCQLPARDVFQRTERLLWTGTAIGENGANVTSSPCVADFISPRSTISTSFLTRFNTGQGSFFNVAGKRVSNGSWNYLSGQDPRRLQQRLFGGARRHRDGRARRPVGGGRSAAGSHQSLAESGQPAVVERAGPDDLVLQRLRPGRERSGLHRADDHHGHDRTAPLVSAAGTIGNVYTIQPVSSTGQGPFIGE